MKFTNYLQKFLATLIVFSLCETTVFMWSMTEIPECLFSGFTLNIWMGKNTHALPHSHSTAPHSALWIPHRGVCGRGVGGTLQ